jgi:diguanylate cyclase (GGDEF)-like protein
VKLRRSKDSETEPVVAEPVARDATPDAALDAVAAILRALGGTALRDPDASSRLEAWARHILVLTPPPDFPDAVPRSRDWTGLSRDVVAHVRNDRAAASRSIGDLQDAVWLVVDGLSQAIVGDDAADASAASQLERLRAAAGGSAAELKATALETVQRLSEIIDEKSTRQREVARELGERVDILRVELEDTRREADIDPLTKLGNRGMFRRELARAAQVSALVNEPACLAMVDIDHFKQINDAHGHAAGDGALEAVANALVRSFPRRRDSVTRFGGDEFAVILRDATAADGSRLAERLLTAVRHLELPGRGDAVRITVSVGVAEALTGEPADSWLARADRALYEAKAEGRDRVAVATEASLSAVVAVGPAG